MDYLEPIINYLEIVKEYIKTFDYWQQIAILASGVLFGYLLRVITHKLHILRIRKKNKSRNMVVIDQQNHRNRSKKGRNANYFKCVQNAQYSTEDWQGTKDIGKR